METRIKINSTQATRKLKTLLLRCNTMPWRQAGEIVKQSIQQSFETGGAYKSASSIMGGPNKWRPRKKSAAWKILRKTGALQRSIYVYPVSDRVYVGSRGLAYNRAQNLGYPQNNLPARPFLVVQNRDIVAIKRLFKNHLTVN